MTKVSKEYQKQRMSMNLRPPLYIKNKLYLPAHGYNGYYVNLEGQIYSEIVKRNIAQCDNGKGYMISSMHKNNGKRHSKKVHQVVTETFFYYTQPDLVPNHKNFDRADNRVTNLELVTRTENMRHMNKAHVYYGRKTNLKRLTKEEVIQIYFAEGSYSQIAKDFNITTGVVTNVKLKIAYRDVTEDFKDHYKQETTAALLDSLVYRLYKEYLYSDINITELAEKNDLLRTTLGANFRKRNLPTKNADGTFKMSINNNYQAEEDSRIINIWLKDYAFKEKVGIPYLVNKYGRASIYYNQNFKRLNLPIKNSGYVFPIELNEETSQRITTEKAYKIWLNEYLKSDISGKALDRKYNKNDYFNGKFKKMGLPKKDRYGNFKMQLIK